MAASVKMPSHAARKPTSPDMRQLHAALEKSIDALTREELLLEVDRRLIARLRQKLGPDASFSVTGKPIEELSDEILRTLVRSLRPDLNAQVEPSYLKATSFDCFVS